ncbi:MAG: hypothetical protein ABSA76_02005, partial [Bacteroidales bacterium]
MKKIYLILMIFLPVSAGIISCSTGKETKPQPVLGNRSVAIIQKHGLKFKDLNKNGKLDKYEDWRLSPDERSKDLLSKMSLEEKAGYMCINSANMVGTMAAEASGNKLSASDLSEGGPGLFGGGKGFGQNRNGERIAGMNSSAGTTKMVKEFHNRHFILRANESARVTAEWANKLQALCESEPL